MYAPFFGLQHLPFSIAPDPRYLFMSERHREALAHLLYGLEAGGGFVLLTGEIGAGKTTVCRCFLEQIPAHCNVAYIFNPKLTVGELLRSICDEFGVPHPAAVPGVETVKDCIDPLNAALLAAHAAGRNNVLIIDEAQNLAPDVLEQLRLLTNLETNERKLLQIILIGQPELRTMVASPALEQLAQRVIARFHLDALSPEETAQYVAHRLSVAGLMGPLPFNAPALRRVHALSRGVPRRINLLCDRALLGAYAAGTHAVDKRTVDQAAREVFDAPAGVRSGSSTRLSSAAQAPGRWPAWALTGIGGLVGAAAVGALAWSLGGWAPRGAAPVSAEDAGLATPAVAATPQAAASAAAAPALAAPLQQFLAAQSAVADDEAQGWKALAKLWDKALPAAAQDACAALQGEGLRCYRTRRAGWALVRQIDRPALLTLYATDAAAANATPVTVLLRRLEGDTATLEGAAGRTLRLPLAQLAPAWRGDLEALWRAPSALPDKGEITDTREGVAWLDAQWAVLTAQGAAAAGGGAAPLAGASAPPASLAERKAQIQRFQKAQGVAVDGRAGPLTLMLLNRALGVPEPTLRPGA